jgi:(p)ppGpp synthase/HD superfamily hydrolase
MEKDAIWQLRADMLLVEITRMSPDAQTIKLADRLANVRDAKRAKKGKKLNRYLWQTNEILKIIPRERNEGLWEAIREATPKSVDY